MSILTRLFGISFVIFLSSCNIFNYNRSTDPSEVRKNDHGLESKEINSQKNIISEEKALALIYESQVERGYSEADANNAVAFTKKVIERSQKPIECQHGPDAPCCSYQNGVLAGPCDRLYPAKKRNEVYRLLIQNGISQEKAQKSLDVAEKVMSGRKQPVNCSDGPEAPCCKYEDGSLAGPCNILSCGYQ